MFACGVENVLEKEGDDLRCGQYCPLAGEVRKSDPAGACMNESVENYTPIQPDTLKRLIDYWLPELHAVRDRRRGMRRLMIFLFSLPLALALAGAIAAYLKGSVSLTEGGALMFISSWAAVSFVYLGKLQACDDAVYEISLTVYLGFVEPMLKAVPKLSLNRTGNVGDRIC